MHCPFWEGKSGDVRALWLERQIFAGLSSGASDHLTANSGRALALALCCCCPWDWLCLQPSVPAVGLWCCTQVQLRWLWHLAGQDTSAEKPKKEVCWEELHCFVFCWWLKESGTDRRTAQDTGFHTSLWARTKWRETMSHVEESAEEMVPNCSVISHRLDAMGYSLWANPARACSKQRDQLQIVY